MVIKELKNEIKNILSLRDTELLITEALSISATEYALSGDNKVTEKDAQRIKEMALRIKGGEPLQYVTGVTEFMDFRFFVRSGVLIPRSDTETLVEKAVSLLQSCNSPAVIDIGTGSGCVGISISKYIENSQVTLVDISDTALEAAEKNAKANNANVTLLKCDILTDIPKGKFDMIVSNPPYIRKDVIPTLDRNVRDFEPHLALDGGEDGLIFYKRISEIAPLLLNKGGAIAFEIGFDQAEDVAKILEENNFSKIDITKDLCGNNRVVTALN